MIHLDYSPSADLKDSKTAYYSNMCTRMLTTALFSKPMLQEQPRCLSMDKWVNKIGIYVQSHDSFCRDLSEHLFTSDSWQQTKEMMSLESSLVNRGVVGLNFRRIGEKLLEGEWHKACVSLKSLRQPEWDSRKLQAGVKVCKRPLSLSSCSLFL